MNLPNLLTLSRIVALFALVPLLMVEWKGCATFAFFLFIFASITDWLDGYVARRYGMISNFGKLMDALADKILVMGMFVVLLALDILPAWSVVLVLIMLSREFLITGLRLVAASKGRVLSAENSGKLKTVIQIICISIFLLQHALELDGLPTHAHLQAQAIDFVHTVGLAFLWVSAILTTTSGIGYMIRYSDLLWEKELV